MEVLIIHVALCCWVYYWFPVCMLYTTFCSSFCKNAIFNICLLLTKLIQISFLFRFSITENCVHHLTVLWVKVSNTWSWRKLWTVEEMSTQVWFPRERLAWSAATWTCRHESLRTCGTSLCIPEACPQTARQGPGQEWRKRYRSLSSSSLLDWGRETRTLPKWRSNVAWSRIWTSRSRSPRSTEPFDRSSCSSSGITNAGRCTSSVMGSGRCSQNIFNSSSLCSCLMHKWP